MTSRYTTDEAAARAWAKRRGIIGRQGGWLYEDWQIIHRPNRPRPLCQGYAQLAGRLRAQGIIRRDDDGKWWIAQQDA